jgi:hypothetical protein
VAIIGTTIVLVAIILLLPSLLILLSRQWVDFSIWSALSFGALGYLTAAIVGPQGEPDGPAAAFVAAIGAIGSIVLTVAWGAFLMSAITKAYTLAKGKRASTRAKANSPTESVPRDRP